MTPGSTTSGFLLAILAVTPPMISVDLPRAIGNSLLAVSRQLAFAGDCAALHSGLRLEEAFMKREKRYWRAVQEAAEIWGNQVNPASLIDLSERPRRSCNERNVVATLREIDVALDAQETLFRQHTNRMGRGVWVGPLKLCRDTVTSTKKGRNEVTDDQTLLVELTKEASAAFASITGRSINQRMAIRVNGEIVSRPMVNEQITGGSLQVQAPDVSVLERAQAIISNVC